MRKTKLTELTIRNLKPETTAYQIWDERQHGLAIRVQPTGSKSWYVVYSLRGRVRWYRVGSTNAVGLADARKLAAEVMLDVIRGKDPAAERKAERGAGTFAELAERHLNEHAKRHNRSWEQADRLVRRYVLPRWGKLQAGTIIRADVKALMAKIEAPILANQVLAAASAIFGWAVKQEIIAANPCRGVDRNESRSRERILADSEVPRFWAAFDDVGLVASCALKMLLLTGQRPGEVTNMRREHIKDGWWEMPGAPMPELGWPGTKNGASHRVWLPTPVREIIAELDDAGATTGFVFPGLANSKQLAATMRAICRKLVVDEKVTPHDLRRTHGSTICALGFGRDAMNRVQNHIEGGIATVYDRHGYAEENKRVMETVAARIMALTTGETDSKVVPIRR
jgi:integrase